MQFAVVTQGGGEFNFNGVLTRDTVTGAWPKALQDLAASSRAVINLANLEQIDTAGLAWLVNLIRDARGQSANLVLTNVPDGLLKLAKISDLDGILPLQ